MTFWQLNNKMDSIVEFLKVTYIYTKGRILYKIKEKDFSWRGVKRRVKQII